MDEKELRRKLGIPAKAAMTIIDMDANPDKYEKLTGGWKDEQIRNKPLEEIEDMIEQSKKVQATLQKNLDDQTQRILSYNLIRDRKLILNNNTT